MDISLVPSEDCCLLPAVYDYPPLNTSQHYPPPRAGDSGGLDCDCNTVMYKYEVPVPKEDHALIAFRFEVSTWLVRRVSRARSTRKTSGSHTLTVLADDSVRWTAWIAACQRVYVSK